MDCNTRTHPPLSLKKFLLPIPPTIVSAIADDTPAAIPNETTVAMNTAAINEHVKEAPFEAMDADNIEALNVEEKHGESVCKIMMNVVAPTSKNGYAKRMWHS